MFKRLLQFVPQEHALLLGPRSTGKSTFLASQFPRKNCLWIDLLLPKNEDAYARNPDRLIDEVAALDKSITHVIVDEIQKVIPLLDVVHSLIESTDKIFILTGSSARKLKAGSANLLAGRALVYHFFPLTSFEIGSAFDLHRALRFGSLPRVWNLKSDAGRRKTLETYALTYLNEEIRAEQAVRKLDPFRKFLEVAAQMNGKILNFAAIAREVGVDEKSVVSYFQILEDTLVGFFVEAYSTSIRKKVKTSPKFFFFDTGVKRALARQLTIDIAPSTYDYGDTFEHFVTLEIFRLINYSGNQFALNYLRTESNVEIDLVVQRPGKALLLVEIKSTTEIQRKHLDHLTGLAADFGEPVEMLCLSNDPRSKKISDVLCQHWQEGLRHHFLGPDLTEV